MAIRKKATAKTKLQVIETAPRLVLAMLCRCNKCKKTSMVECEDKGTGLGPNCEKCGLPMVIKAIQG